MRKIKPWHLLLFGLTVFVVGASTHKFSVVPYEPAIKAGYPDAKHLVLRPWPPFVMMIGLSIILFAVTHMIYQRLNRSEDLHQDSAPK